MICLILNCRVRYLLSILSYQFVHLSLHYLSKYSSKYQPLNKSSGYTLWSGYQASVNDSSGYYCDIIKIIYKSVYLF